MCKNQESRHCIDFGSQKQVLRGGLGHNQSVDLHTMSGALGKPEVGWVGMGFRDIPRRSNKADRPPLPGERKRKGWM